MELNQLRQFIRVAKLEHMTKAAKSLYIAQPALSKTIGCWRQSLKLSIEKEIK